MQKHQGPMGKFEVRSDRDSLKKLAEEVLAKRKAATETSVVEVESDIVVR